MVCSVKSSKSEIEALAFRVISHRLYLLAILLVVFWLFFLVVLCSFFPSLVIFPCDLMTFCFFWSVCVFVFLSLYFLCFEYQFCVCGYHEVCM